MLLAAKKQRANVSEVAEFFGISVNHVAKVVNILARNGYIRSVRGIGGGIELAKAPEDIVLGEVIVLMEGDTHLLACVGDDDSCSIHSFCKLKNVLAEAERRHMDYLASVTLADVVPSKRHLKQVN